MKLSAIQHNSSFSLLALDTLTEIADQCGSNLQTAEGKGQLEGVMATLVKEYAGAYSGVLLAPEVGYSALYDKKDQAGVLFPLERRLYDADPLTIPILKDHWGVEVIAQNYGVAKLELYYHPEEKEAAIKQQMVGELYEYCRHEGIDLLLELVIYIEGTEAEYIAQLPSVQLAAVQDFRSSCSLLALEYPFNALNTVTLTAELDIPWILTARATAYDQFKEQLRTALESGAQGYMAGSFFLPPPPTTGTRQWNASDVQSFITTTGKDRAHELYRIVSER